MNEFNNKKVKYLYTGKLENIAGEIKGLNKWRERNQIHGMQFWIL